MREFWKFKSLLYELVIRDIKIKYRRSILGVLWTILNPLLMMLILYVVFSKLFRFEIKNYAIYILSGQIIFNYYQAATTDAMSSILGNASLIKKIYIPKYMLVLAKTLSASVNLLASLLALLVVIVVTGGRLTAEVLLVPIPFICVILFSLGVGLVLAAVTVRFRDIMHLYGVFCTGLFYLTPVIYPASILPEYMKQIVYYNPITRIIAMFRELIMEYKLPVKGDLIYCILSATAMVLIGMLVFWKRQKKFILDL